jgi:poly(beta-D-mannuronate) lyase
MMVLRRLLVAVLATLAATAATAEDCPQPPEPVLSLSFNSRYVADSTTRSEIDPDAAEEADDALRPVDDFLRDLTALANDALRDDGDAAAAADCAISQIAVWARANALGDMSSMTPNLTVGSRLAGFGLVLLQVLPHTSRDEDVAAIKDWLAGLMRMQTQFWEADATDGARVGNLRAWAALGGASIATVLDDSALLAWATWSVSYILCSAEPDGSLPQEMRRGNLALRYQLHAIAPLVVATRLIEREGISIQSVCDDALARVVLFAMQDIDDGRATQAITGEVQSFFDGSDELEEFHFAWIEAYLQLDDMPNSDVLDRFAEQYRPIGYSKLGGNQTLIWQALD